MKSSTLHKALEVLEEFNNIKGYAIFGATPINSRWLHLSDSQTTAIYSVSDIAKVGVQQMQDSLLCPDEYSDWCHAVGPHRIEDLPPSTQKVARRLGLVTANW